MDKQKKTGETPGEYDSFPIRPLTAEETERIENNFSYHQPFGMQPRKYEIIRSWAKSLAIEFCHLCPPSRELSLALTKLEEAVFWANAAIARNEKDDSNT